MSKFKKHINTELIKSFNPCEKGIKNWLYHYKDFDGDILDFLELENIPPRDKIWLSVRVLPKEIVEYFAIDCAFSAQANAAYADDAAYAAAYAAYAAAYAAYAADAAAANAAAAAANAAYTANAAYAAAAYAADAAAYAAAAAAYAAAADAERENQVDALIMLINLSVTS